METEKKFVRICPDCGSNIYHTDKYNCIKCEKKNRKCKRCAYDDRKLIYSGEGNPFFNKKHSDFSKETQSKIKIGKHCSPSTEFKKGHIIDYECNPIKIWKLNCDDETYNEKFKKLKAKHSQNNSGKNNPMFGKPSPNGSGNGWSGWYNGWFFRSIGELSFMIKVIERFKINWVSAETFLYKITYNDYKGTSRNYFADFVLNDKYLVECKPKKLWFSDENKRKREAAIKYCNEKGLIYKVIDPHRLTNDEIFELWKNGNIKFLEKYEIKMKIKNEKEF